MKVILLFGLVLSPVSFAGTAAAAENWDCSTAYAGLSTYCKLDPVKRQDVHNAYNLARMFNEQGLFDLCLEQIGEVKKAVEGLHDSKRIELECIKMRDDELRVVNTERSERQASESTIRRNPTSIPKLNPVIKKSN